MQDPVVYPWVNVVGNFVEEGETQMSKAMGSIEVVLASAVVGAVVSAFVSADVAAVVAAIVAEIVAPVAVTSVVVASAVMVPDVVLGGDGRKGSASTFKTPFFVFEALMFCFGKRKRHPDRYSLTQLCGSCLSTASSI